MAVEFVIKQNDQLPALIVTCLDGAEPVDLLTATSARLLMRNLSAGLKVDAEVEILDQTDDDNLGKVTYEWEPTDTDTVGTFNAEIEVTWPDGKIQTFPASKTQKYFKVIVLNDLDED